jgi:hypothetical protein
VTAAGLAVVEVVSAVVQMEAVVALLVVAQDAGRREIADAKAATHAADEVEIVFGTVIAIANMPRGRSLRRRWRD